MFIGPAISTVMAPAVVSAVAGLFNGPVPLLLLIIVAILGILWLLCHGTAFRQFRLGSLTRIKIGASDVQANYSRGYTWSANQFGHISLGLLAALLYRWIGDAACLGGAMVFGDEASAGACSGAGDKPIELQRTGLWVALITLSLLAAGIWGLAVRRIMLAFDYDGRPEDTPGLSARAQSGLGWRPFWMTVGIAFPVFFCSYGLLELTTGAPAAYVRILYPSAVILGVMIMLSASFSAREQRVFVFGASVLGVATWLGVEAALVPTAAAADWIEPAMAAIAGAVMWWVKEWANDLAKVDRELRESFAKRQSNADGAAWPRFDWADESRVRAVYSKDATRDTIFDTVFYTIGAFLGFSILFEGSLLEPDSPWSTGIELTAFFTMLMVFVIIATHELQGSMALDRLAAPYTSRLAVFRGAVCFPSSETRPENGVSAPLDWVKRFARRGDLDAEKVDARDLIIAGPAGSGRTPLAIALACEAALAETESWQIDPEPERDLARYVTWSDLIKRAERWDSEEFTPLDPAKARVLVIDDVPSNPDGAGPLADPGAVAQAIALIETLNDDRRTVWVVETQTDCPMTQFAALEATRTMLAGALAAAPSAPGASPRPVAACLLKKLPPRTQDPTESLPVSACQQSTG